MIINKTAYHYLVFKFIMSSPESIATVEQLQGIVIVIIVDYIFTHKGIHPYFSRAPIIKVYA